MPLEMITHEEHPAQSRLPCQNAENFTMNLRFIWLCTHFPCSRHLKGISQYHFLRLELLNWAP